MTRPPAPESHEPHCHLAQCACVVGSVEVDGNLYCSRSCADPEARAAEICGCGHDTCRKDQGHVERPIPSREPLPRPEPLVPPPIVL
jgi:hypothetical protein